MNNTNGMASQQRSQVQHSSAEQAQQARRQQLLRQQKYQQQLQQSLRSDKLNPQKVKFASSSSEILAKYARYPPSLTFHIYESHYRFNNLQDSSIIPKKSPMIKSFLRHVLKEEIPIEMSELLKDFSIRAYDGCLILQVYDHRNMVTNGSNADPKVKREISLDAPNKDSSSNGKIDSSKDSESSDGTSSGSTNSHKPKTYRTLLRPTQLSIYYDLLYHTDSALTKFTDPLSLQMESEILALTNRNLDLSVPLNPYLCDDYLHPEVEYPRKVWDEKTQDHIVIHSHREEVEHPPRRLHQDELTLHKSSDYEEIMFLLSNKYRRNDELSDKKLVVVGPSSLSTTATTTTSTVPASSQSSDKDDILGSDIKPKKPEKESSTLTTNAPVVKANPSTTSTSTGQFMRLRFIEEIRKRKEAQKAQEEANGASSSPPHLNTGLQVSKNPILSQNPNKSTTPKAQVPPQPQNPQIQGQRTIPVGNMQKHQYLDEKMQAMKTNQLQAQQIQARQKAAPPSMAAQASKRQKREPVPDQPGQPSQQFGTTPHNPSVNLDSSNANPARMNNAQQRGSQSSSQVQPSSGQTLQQQQQQQIFQSSLTPQEQHTFRQLQSRMNAFAMMGNSGIAPNRTQLTQQQQQQAIQQAKLIQQQLIQKFPIYFQRLRQFQLLQQQRQQQQQGQQPQRPQQFPGNSSSQNTENHTQFNPSGTNLMPNGLSQQQRYNQQMLQQMANMSELEKRKNAYNKIG